MRSFNPLTLDDSNVTTDVPETDHDEWASGEIYAEGDVVQKSTAHGVWESLADGNEGNDPELTDDRVSETPSWFYLGKTNPWLIVDEYVNTQTEAADSMTYEVTPGEIVDGIALFMVEAQTVSVTMTDPVEGIVYESEHEMVDYEVDDFYEYFFEPIRNITSLVLTDLPPYPNATITITFEDDGGTVKCGTLLIGLQTYVGATRWGPRLGRQSFSRKDRNSFGQISLKKGETARRIELDLFIANGSVDYVDRFFARIDGVKTVFIGDDVDAGFNSLNLYGFSRDFQIVVPGPSVSECSVEIEEFI